MIIEKQDIDFLEANKHHWKLWQKAQVFNHLDYGVRERLLMIIHKYWSPVYNANLWCSPCIVDMLKYVYSQYDQYLLSIGDDGLNSKVD